MQRYRHTGVRLPPFQGALMADKQKRLARALQKRANWAYTECLRCVRERIEGEALEQLIASQEKAQ